MHYRFTLEKYKGKRTRYTCPACGHGREFARYADTQTGRHLADHVGRCNREVNCGYHYTPKQYFADNNITSQDSNHRRQAKKHRPPERESMRISTIPFEMFRDSLTDYERNNFARYLHGQFGAAVASELIRRFHIGTSGHWKGATVFWQIDVKGRVRSGKIMLYEADTGRRVKETQPDGSKKGKITWAHSILLKQGAIQDFNLRQCLFGEHQLAARSAKPVAVVESEKTAIIATPYLPDFIWLACGSLTNLTAERCGALAGRKVVLFPDLKCFEKWWDRAGQLQALLDCDITVSDLLERKAGQMDREQGFDLADYLVRQPITSGEYEAGIDQEQAERPALPVNIGELAGTLPHEIYIPASVPNTVDAIRACILAQMKRRAA